MEQVAGDDKNAKRGYQIRDEKEPVGRGEKLIHADGRDSKGEGKEEKKP